MPSKAAFAKQMEALDQQARRRVLLSELSKPHFQPEREFIAAQLHYSSRNRAHAAAGLLFQAILGEFRLMRPPELWAKGFKRVCPESVDYVPGYRSPAKMTPDDHLVVTRQELTKLVERRFGVPLTYQQIGRGLQVLDRQPWFHRTAGYTKKQGFNEGWIYVWFDAERLWKLYQQVTVEARNAGPKNLSRRGKFKQPPMDLSLDLEKVFDDRHTIAVVSDPVFKGLKQRLAGNLHLDSNRLAYAPARALFLVLLEMFDRHLDNQTGAWRYVNPKLFTQDNKRKTSVKELQQWAWARQHVQLSPRQVRRAFLVLKRAGLVDNSYGRGGYQVWLNAELLKQKLEIAKPHGLEISTLVTGNIEDSRNLAHSLAMVQDEEENGAEDRAKKATDFVQLSSSYNKVHRADNYSICDRTHAPHDRSSLRYIYGLVPEPDQGRRDGDRPGPASPAAGRGLLQFDLVDNDTRTARFHLTPTQAQIARLVEQHDISCWDGSQVAHRPTAEELHTLIWLERRKKVTPAFVKSFRATLGPEHWLDPGTDNEDWRHQIEVKELPRFLKSLRATVYEGPAKEKLITLSDVEGHLFRVDALIQHEWIFVDNYYEEAMTIHPDLFLSLYTDDLVGNRRPGQPNNVEAVIVLSLFKEQLAARFPDKPGLLDDLIQRHRSTIKTYHLWPNSLLITVLDLCGIPVAEILGITTDELAWAQGIAKRTVLAAATKRAMLKVRVEPLEIGLRALRAAKPVSRDRARGQAAGQPAKAARTSTTGSSEIAASAGAGEEMK